MVAPAILVTYNKVRSFMESIPEVGHEQLCEVLLCLGSADREIRGQEGWK